MEIVRYILESLPSLDDSSLIEDDFPGSKNELLSLFVRIKEYFSKEDRE